MIQQETWLEVADNSGAKKIECIRVLKKGSSSGRAIGDVGDIIVASVKEVSSSSTKIEKGKVVKAVIVRVKKRKRRKNGSFFSSDENAAVLVNEKGEPIGTRVFGPIDRTLREAGSFNKILSLAPEVI